MTCRNSTWNLILDGPLPGTFNMAFDEALLKRASSPQCPPVTYLRFYQWKCPTLSLGFFQKARRVADLEFCRLSNIPVVRRLTGGKAVLHDRELTYSVVSNDPAFFPFSDIAGTYNRIAQALSRGFSHMGVETSLAAEDSRPHQRLSPACFTAANHHELLWKGRKLAGSAQRRTRAGFLQHGSILIEFSARQLAGCLGIADVATMQEHVTDLSQALGRSPSAEEVVSAMSKGFQEVFEVQLQTTEVDPEVVQEARELTKAKYEKVEWETPQHSTIPF